MANEILNSDLTKVKDIDFTLQFEKGIESLMEMLGVTRKIEKKAGEDLKVYKVTGTLGNGVVAEGTTIPLTNYKTTYTSIGTATLKKWRKRTTIEAISNKGFGQAVNDTTDKMRRQIQAGIKSQFTAFLATGTGTATGVGLQAALADAWGQLQVLFEDTSIEAVYFVNPLDVSKYLGTAQITTQTAFGMSYIENFLGLGTVIMDSTIPQGTIYATAVENIVLYYVSVSGSDVAQAFDLTTDETGLIGVHTGAEYNDAAVDTVAYSGVGLFAEQLGGIVVGTITQGA